MKINKGNIEYRFSYRLPWEFVFCARKLRRALCIWFYYEWIDTMRDLWTDKGYRLLGFEFMKRIYGGKSNDRK